ncbi:MAG: alpha-(1-_3)-arabinofuranosyltransferase family protein [Actinomycetes bacterium]
MAVVGRSGAGEPTPAAAAPSSGRARWLDRIGLVAFAALAYLPILAMRPGRVAADTKSYLYLDPTRFISRAASLWDAKTGMGTLSHQMIGYLFPMGPWYWFTEDVLGMPAWIAQRLWLGTIVLAAGLGMRALAREFGIGRAGALVAMLAYAFSPYALGYSGFYSPLLGPWAALPWWIVWTRRGIRERGWLYPAMIAISIQLVGSLNASSLLWCLIGPALWLPFAVLGVREASWRDGWSFAWRTGVLTAVTSLWWFLALAIEGRFGVNILRFTETVSTVTATSTPSEIVRGLGYWFFYGGDRLGPWNDARSSFTQRLPFILTSFLVPTLAFAGAALVRWRARAYFVLLVVAGVVIAVGAAPYDDPSPYGEAFKWFTLNSPTGFALRNVNRAVPIVIVGLAALLGAGVDVVTRRYAERGRPLLAGLATALVAALCLSVAVPALSGHYYSEYLERDGAIPGYWQRAIRDLAAGDPRTRVLALPGSDFASYRWGDTRDPIEPGLMDRPYVAREIVPLGSEQAVAFLQAVDRRVQDGSVEPDGLAEVLRLMRVGSVLLRLDLRTDQWNIVPSGTLWKIMTDDPAAGLSSPVRYGTRIPGRLRFPELGDLTRPNAEQADPPPVAIMEVEDPSPIYGAKTADAPILIAGDGEGIVDLAAASLLDSDRVVLFASSYAGAARAMRDLPESTLLVLTDSNRRRGQRWGVLHDQFGYTEVAGEAAITDDPTDQRLEVFPGSTDADRTVAELSGVRSVRATSYGIPAFGFSPSERPAAAFDGDVKTGWRVDAGLPVGNERLEVVLERPTTTNHVNIMQVSPSAALRKSARYRSIRSVRLTFDDGPSIVRTLTRASKRKRGQTLTFPERTFQRLDITILDSTGKDIEAAGRRNAVGLSEVRIPAPDGDGSVRVAESMRMPTAMLRTLGADSLRHPLAIVLTREGTMDATRFSRRFTLPTARSFSFAGTARLSPYARDQDIDRALGAADASDGAYTASSSARYVSVLTRAGAATDGDPTTAWVSTLGNPRAELKLEFPAPRTIDRMTLQLVTDGLHSVPRVISIRADKGPRRNVTLPILATKSPSGLTEFPISFPAVTGRKIRVSVRTSVPVRRAQIVLPAAIAELGIPGTQRSYATELAGECTDRIVTIDGRPFPVRIPGTTRDAIDEEKLPVIPCGPDLTLGAGEHEIRVAESPRNPTGFDVSRIVLASAAGGEAASAAEVTGAPPSTEPDPSSGAAAVAAGTPRARPRTPEVRVVDETRWTASLRVSRADAPFWLVLGQSYNDGWRATADGMDLGEPQLVDGYANAWYIRPKASGPMRVELAWAPQRAVNIALWVSLAGGIACLVIVGVGLRRRRRRPAPRLDGPQVRVSTTVGAVERRRRVGLSVGAALIAGLTIGPIVGIVTGLVAWVACGGGRIRRGIRLAPPVLLLVIAVGTPVQQRIERHTAAFDWTSHFEWARWLAWCAVVALALDVLVATLRREDGPGATDERA